MTTISGHTTRATGTILTASIYNNDHTNHITNANALNSGKVEAAVGPVGDGNIPVFDGTTGNAITDSGLTPLAQSDIDTSVSALETELASTDNGEGASKIGVEDASTLFTGDDVEAVLAEIGAALAVAISYSYRSIADISGGDTIVAGDLGALVEIQTGTGTLALTAAATLGSSFACEVKNNGTGVVTIDPNSTEQINGATTLVLYAGDSAHIFCNGAAFFAVLIPGTEPVILGSGSFAAANSQVFATGIPERFSALELQITNLSSNTNARHPLIQLGTGAGPTYDTTAGNYAGVRFDGGTNDLIAEASIVFVQDFDATANFDCSITIKGYQANSYSHVYGMENYDGFDIALLSVHKSLTAITAMRMIWSGSGNSDGGTYTLKAHR